MVNEYRVYKCDNCAKRVSEKVLRRKRWLFVKNFTRAYSGNGDGGGSELSLRNYDNYGNELHFCSLKCFMDYLEKEMFVKVESERRYKEND